jgi:CRP/FNR family transcriptional regulator, cyclic AMP receptor protein
MQPFTKTFKAGASLFHEKDHSRELYIIQEGSVLISRKIGSKELVLARLEKGSVFGEMALIDGKPRSASAKALTDCTLILIDADTFHDRVRGVPQWFMSIIRTTSEKIRKANQRLQTVSADHLDSKIVIMLSHFFSRYGAADPESGVPSIDMAKTKRQLIQLLCLTHGRLVRVLGFLQKNGFIDVLSDRICLKDDRLLRDYCDFLRALLNKAYDRRPASIEGLEAFCAAVPEKVVGEGENSEVHREVGADDFWEIVQAAGLEDAWKETVLSFKDIGMLTTRKSEDHVQEGNPCGGSAFIIDINVLKRWMAYFRFSSMVPEL